MVLPKKIPGSIVTPRKKINAMAVPVAKLIGNTGTESTLRVKPPYCSRKTKRFSLMSRQTLKLSTQPLDSIFADQTTVKTSTITETYGEILSCDFSKLYQDCHFTSNDVFYDLGSGKGQLLAHVFIETCVKKSCGIEIVDSLAMQSKINVEKVRQTFPASFTDSRELSIHHGSFFDISFDDATVIFINGLCFGQAFLLRLATILNKLPYLRLLITSRAIPELTLTFKKTLRLECSWDTTLFYIYTN